jgi:3,4-dihydroxyphenylacetate 2,3-dioxygenase
MGTLELAAKVTHVPSIWLSENSPEHKGIRSGAIAGLGELGRRAAARGVETFLVLDVHWIVNQGFHINAHESSAGLFTSHELPHMLSGLEYSYRGDPDLADAIVSAAASRGLGAVAQRVEGLGFEYGTLIPMRHMNRELGARVVPIAANAYADLVEHRLFGEAIREAIEATERRVAFLASGSLSHQFWPNAVSRQGLDTVNTEFNRQVDLRVLELWKAGEIETFLAMLPEYIERCHGEVGMADTATLFGVLGWDRYRGRGEVIGEYFGSSGTGQCNVEFPVQG